MGKNSITMPEADKLQAEDLKILESIIKDKETPASVRIQAIQCREKIVSEVKKGNTENNPQQNRMNEIMNHIRKPG